MKYKDQGFKTHEKKVTQTNIYTDTFLDSGIVKLGILQNIIHYLALKKITQD